MKKRYGNLIKTGLLLLAGCFLLTGCVPFLKKDAEMAAEGAPNAAQTKLDVWFFACSEDADSILLKTPAADIMIDTGVEEDSERLTERLREIGVEDIELLILTHPDKDHIGGASKILSEFPVKQVIQTSCDKESELQEELNRLLLRNPGEEAAVIPKETLNLSYGELQLTVYPAKEEEYKNSNNYSIGVLAEYEGITFFFAGDAKKKRIEELLDEKLPKVNVYKTAHHGRDNGASKELIELLAPEYAVVTAPQPEPETEKAFSQFGTVVYSSYENEVHFSVTQGILDVG